MKVNFPDKFSCPVQYKMWGYQYKENASWSQGSKEIELPRSVFLNKKKTKKPSSGDLGSTQGNEGSDDKTFLWWRCEKTVAVVNKWTDYPQDFCPHREWIQRQIFKDNPLVFKQLKVRRDKMPTRDYCGVTESPHKIPLSKQKKVKLVNDVRQTVHENKCEYRAQFTSAVCAFKW